VLRRFFAFTREWFQREVKAAMNILFNTSLITFSLGNTVALAIGAYLYQAGEMTIGTVYLLFHYTNMLIQPVERITQQLGDLQIAGACIGRINEILTEVTTLLDGRGEPLPPGPYPCHSKTSLSDTIQKYPFFRTSCCSLKKEKSLAC